MSRQMPDRPNLRRTSQQTEQEKCMSALVQHSLRLSPADLAATLGRCEVTARRRQKGIGWKLSESFRLAQALGCDWADLFKPPTPDLSDAPRIFVSTGWVKV